MREPLEAVIIFEHKNNFSKATQTKILFLYAGRVELYSVRLHDTEHRSELSLFCLRLSLPYLPQGFPFYPSLAARQQGMKTTPPIDLQASCFNMDTYIFNEELLQCSAPTDLLEYVSI